MDPTEDREKPEIEKAREFLAAHRAVADILQPFYDLDKYHKYCSRGLESAGKGFLIKGLLKIFSGHDLADSIEGLPNSIAKIIRLAKTWYDDLDPKLKSQFSEQINAIGLNGSTIGELYYLFRPKS